MALSDSRPFFASITIPCLRVTPGVHEENHSKVNVALEDVENNMSDGAGIMLGKMRYLCVRHPAP